MDWQLFGVRLTCQKSMVLSKQVALWEHEASASHALRGTAQFDSMQRAQSAGVAQLPVPTGGQAAAAAVAHDAAATNTHVNPGRIRYFQKLK
jgi:hypothetical protein